MKCPNCREHTVKVVNENYSETIMHDGQSYDITIPNLPTLVCYICNYRTLNREASIMIGVALREAAGLMQPKDIKECRKKLSQKVLADYVGIDLATLLRWENGGQIQLKDYDEKLRLYFKSEPHILDETEFANLNNLYVFLNEFDVVELVKKEYAKYGNDAPPKLLQNQIEKLEKLLEKSLK